MNAYSNIQGPLRELIFIGSDLEPAEGANPTIRLSGRSGPSHISGTGTVYGESNPHIGYLSQDVAMDMETFKKISAAQTAGTFGSITVTTVENKILDGKMRISNDGAIELNNGIVTLEFQGNLRPR